MGWLIPSIVSALMSCIVITIIFFYLSRQNKKRYQLMASLEQTKQSLFESESIFDLLIDKAWDIIFFVRYSDGSIIRVNNSAINTYGYSETELLNMHIADIRDPATHHELSQQLSKAFENGTRFETLHRKKDGTVFPVEVSSAGISINNEFILMSIIRDISERRNLELQQIYASTHDMMTGLYNRLSFDNEIARLDSEKIPCVGMMIMDIDGLKLINDTLGHQKGDECIHRVIEIIKSCFSQQDRIYRIGGDEFVMIFDSCAVSFYEQESARINAAFNEYNQHNNNPSELIYEASIGFAFRSGNDISLTEIFKEADKNMYREKLSKSRSHRSASLKILLKMIEERDFVGQGHLTRMKNYMSAFAEFVGIPKHKINDLLMFAELHDIGKIGVSDSILNKQTPLDEEELAEIHRHSEIGYRIAISSPDFSHLADFILKHHEWWNGSGYPMQLQGEQIPPECRMLAIIDAYDAMTNLRPYRQTISSAEASAELQKASGTQFDPQLLSSFIDMLNSGKYELLSKLSEYSA